jgi:hypothetical protein
MINFHSEQLGYKVFYLRSTAFHPIGLEEYRIATEQQVEVVQHVHPPRATRLQAMHHRVYGVHTRLAIYLLVELAELGKGTQIVESAYLSGIVTPSAFG